MKLAYDIDGGEFIAAGNAASEFKKVLKQLGLPPELIRRVSIAMYEAEINMVIHADGGTIGIDITPEHINMAFKDRGPGIPDVDLAMKAGYSTASQKAREMGFGAGMGLPNMKRYSDEMDIETVPGQGTTVTMSFALQ